MLLNKLIRDKQPPGVVEAARKQTADDNKQPETPAGKPVLDRHINGLDIGKGLERYDGDAHVYVRILRSYADSVRDMLDFIRVVDEGDIHAYKVRVHGIKGASYDIYANPIGKKAEALENAANGGDLAFIRDNNQSFITNAEAFINDIENMLEAIQEKNPKPKKDKPDPDLLSKLFDACEIYSMKETEATMEALEQYEYETDGELIHWLRENVIKINYTQVAERLAEYLAENK
jgi:hypothetical protein